MSLQGQALQVLFFSYLLFLLEEEVDHKFEDLLVFVTGAGVLQVSLGFGKTCDFIWSNCTLLWNINLLTWTQLSLELFKHKPTLTIVKKTIIYLFFINSNQEMQRQSGDCVCFLMYVLVDGHSTRV